MNVLLVRRRPTILRALILFFGVSFVIASAVRETHRVLPPLVFPGLSQRVCVCLSPTRCSPWSVWMHFG
jgi:hypothetical protein